jgi:uncharacterized protein
MNTLITNRIKDLKILCQQYNVASLYAFGSVCSDKFTKDSDLDFLLTFKSNISIQEYTDNYFDLHYKLEDLFQRKIDLVTDKSLSNPYFIQSIDQSKQLIYES